MPVYELAALGAALCWALSSLLAPAPVAHLGAFAFTRIRMIMVLVMLVVWVAASGTWHSIESDHILPIVASGAIGIFLGDTALFMTLARLGPRRTSILFATNAPMAVILGWFILGETLSTRELTGIAIVVAGVVLAIIFGKRRSQLHQWEAVQGPVWIGVAIGLVAALSQAAGSLIAKPVMEAGADPVAVTALRVAVSVACFQAALVLPFDMMRQKAPLTWRISAVTAFSGFLAMALGMSLLLFGLRGGEVGIVATLSATTPALLLPMIWARTGEIPAIGAWVGAALVVVGSGLIFT